MYAKSQWITTTCWSLFSPLQVIRLTSERLERERKELVASIMEAQLQPQPMNVQSPSQAQSLMPESVNAQPQMQQTVSVQPPMQESVSAQPNMEAKRETLLQETREAPLTETAHEPFHVQVKQVGELNEFESKKSFDVLLSVTVDKREWQGSPVPLLLKFKPDIAQRVADSQLSRDLATKIDKRDLQDATEHTPSVEYKQRVSEEKHSDKLLQITDLSPIPMERAFLGPTEKQDRQVSIDTQSQMLYPLMDEQLQQTDTIKPTSTTETNRPISTKDLQTEKHASRVSLKDQKLPELPRKERLGVNTVIGRQPNAPRHKSPLSRQSDPFSSAPNMHVRHSRTALATRSTIQIAQDSQPTKTQRARNSKGSLETLLQDMEKNPFVADPAMGLFSPVKLPPNSLGLYNPSDSVPEKKVVVDPVLVNAEQQTTRPQTPVIPSTAPPVLNTVPGETPAADTVRESVLDSLQDKPKSPTLDTLNLVKQVIPEETSRVSDVTKPLSVVHSKTKHSSVKESQPSLSLKESQPSLGLKESQEILAIPVNRSRKPTVAKQPLSKSESDENPTCSDVDRVATQGQPPSVQPTVVRQPSVVTQPAVETSDVKQTRDDHPQQREEPTHKQPDSTVTHLLQRLETLERWKSQQESNLHVIQTQQHTISLLERRLRQLEHKMRKSSARQHKQHVNFTKLKKLGRDWIESMETKQQASLVNKQQLEAKIDQQNKTIREMREEKLDKIVFERVFDQIVIKSDLTKYLKRSQLHQLLHDKLTCLVRTALLDYPDEIRQRVREDAKSITADMLQSLKDIQMHSPREDPALDRQTQEADKQKQDLKNESIQIQQMELTDRDYDEKLYLILKDVSGLKAMMALQQSQPFFRTGQWVWKSGKIRQESAIVWDLETCNTGI
ncbi:hypothetical protein EDD86DRAFT_261638 [Gorgonomyces haynaldii]|nr:hypothetical protein EDD86DRAFT_261638 [Gorgonomyces haynaldii]